MKASAQVRTTRWTWHVIECGARDEGGWLILSCKSPIIKLICKLDYNISHR